MRGRFYRNVEILLESYYYKNDIMVEKSVLKVVKRSLCYEKKVFDYLNSYIGSFVVCGWIYFLCLIFC